MQKKLITLTSLFTLSFCAHHKDVRPGVEGVHTVKLQSAEKEKGAREALEQANNFCEELDQTAAIISESQTYTGDMDEETYNNIRRVGKVAKSVGGAIFVGGAQKESDVGGAVGVGGAAMEEAAGEGYTIEMTFKCI